MYPVKTNPKDISCVFHRTQSFFSKKLVTSFALQAEFGSGGRSCPVSFSRAKRRTSPLPLKDEQLDRDQATTRKVGGRIRSLRIGGIFLGISYTTRIVPFLQQGQRVISTPVSLSIICSIEFLSTSSSAVDCPKPLRIFRMLFLLRRLDKNPK